MNYKLLSNIQYQVHSRCNASGTMTVKVDLEHLMKFDEDLIVQNHSKDERHALVDIIMLKYEREEYSVMGNDTEIKRFSSEDQAHDFIESKVASIPALDGLLELEIVDVEDFRVPPSHEIRRQVLSQLVVSNDDYNDDDRGVSKDIYDGYIPDGCASDGTPLFT